MRFRLRTLLIYFSALCFFLALNARPRLELLGHVASDKPPIAPGLWILGRRYGWPWTYRAVSFKTEEISIDSFDRFDWPWLAANLIVGLGAVACVSLMVGLTCRLVVKFAPTGQTFFWTDNP